MIFPETTLLEIYIGIIGGLVVVFILVSVPILSLPLIVVLEGLRTRVV